MSKWILFLLLVVNVIGQNEFDKHVRKLTKQLKSPDEQSKIAALHSLGHLGEHAAPAIPMMISLLKKPQSKVAQKTLETFARLGAVAKPAGYELIKLLSSKDKKTVLLVRKALIAMKDGAVGQLLKNIDHESTKVRCHILFILGEIRSLDTHSFILNKLNDNEWQVRFAALEALGKIGANKAQQEVLQRLFDENLQVQILAVKTCGAIKPANEMFLPPLAKIFAKDSLVLRKAILQSISDMKITSVKINKILVRSLRNKKMQKLAIKAIGKIRSVKMTKELLPFLQDSNTNIKIAAIDSIGNLENEALVFLDDLIPIATDGSVRVRMHTANAIGKIGEKAATAAMPVLLSLLEDIESEVQTYAAIALGKMGKKAVSILRDIIIHKPRLRSHAAYALGQIGRDSIPTLIELLNKPQKSVQFYAAEALGRIEHEDTQQAIPILIKLLKQSKNKQQFVEVLGKIGPKAANDLIPLLAEKKWQVRKAAADTLVLIGPAVIPLLAQTVRHNNKYVVLYSISVIGRLQDKSLAPSLVEIYKSTPDAQIKKSIVIALGQVKEGVSILNDALLLPSLREEALVAIEKIARDAPQTVNNLATVLQKEQWHLRKKAARCLSQIGKPAVAKLMDVLANGDRIAQAFSVIALGNMGQDAAQAVPQLITTLHQTNDKALKENIMFALVSIKVQIKDIMMALQKYLSSEDLRLKRAAILAIGKMGELGAVYIPKFLYEAQQSPKKLRSVVVNAIAEMGEKAIRYIVPFLKNKEMLHREIIAAALGKMGQSAHKALPFIVSALENSSGDARKEMIKAIRDIGPQGAFAIPMLSVFLRYEDWQVRELAAQAIGAMGKKAEIAVPVLLPLLGDSSWPVRNAVSETLAKIGGQTTVLGLTTALRKPFVELRIHALITLKDLGPQAYSAVDEILKILRSDSSVRVRSNAIYALGKIAPKETKVRRELVKLLKDKNWQIRQAISFVLKQERD
ncbi:HEAT repeat domain-containing protein [Candidatus Uabimicrobium amorphum]|uniref:HEAT repeat-containing PBS lyase n=1 Tax=Uabimicrobium amorphum TaxID=2596890 RepID=A0A5S9F1T5_UABAM|nr:HEAT repeat domain-containing protein [Candidatus Uabimicrobium amorphum]BBM82955.1 HEAT repeat-containing PBS lyase [Candidatus Uabimicrobium amorphum]